MVLLWAQQQGGAEPTRCRDRRDPCDRWRFGLQLVPKANGNNGTRCADRVTARQRPAASVDAGRIEIEVANADHGLNGESFHDFSDRNRGRGYSGTTQRRSHRFNRCQARALRITP